MEQRKRDPGRAWLVVVLLFFFMLINFADKAVIGLAAVPIMKDLDLTNSQFGVIGSSFFLLFSISAVLVGFLVNRVGSKWVIAAMALVWALTQFPMVGTVGFSVLIASRIILGAGEGPAYPVALHAAYKWFPNSRRTVPTSIVSIGAATGTGLAAPAITWIIRNYSWHAAFAVLGIIGLVWVAVWLAFGREGSYSDKAEPASDAPEERVPYARLLLSGTALATFLAGFVAYWALTLHVVWVPAYLAKGAGFDPQTVGWLVTLPSFAQIVLSPSIGYAAQRLKLTGISSRWSRGALGGGCVMAAGLAMISMTIVPVGAWQIAFLTLAFSIGSAIYTLGPAVIGEISPQAQRGAMLGISNALYTTAGLLAPWIMGRIIDVGADPAAGYANGFRIAGAIVLAGGLIAALFIRPEADIARMAGRPAVRRIPLPAAG